MSENTVNEQGNEGGSVTVALPEKPKPERKPTFDPVYIRDLSEKVYRMNLIRDSGEGAPDRMIAKDEDGGEKLRNRAAAYDKLTRSYLKVLGFEPPVKP